MTAMTTRESIEWCYTCKDIGGLYQFCLKLIKERDVYREVAVLKEITRHKKDDEIAYKMAKKAGASAVYIPRKEYAGMTVDAEAAALMERK